MTTFALVHGAWHGAWCWERLTPLLQQAGHDVVTMDLPIDDVAATFDTYADVVCSEDQILRPEWSRRVALERLGANAIELHGDHSPFYSRPSVLADVLLGLAT